MGWCPQCGCEYRPEITRCPKCNVAIVGEEPPEKPHAPSPFSLQVKNLSAPGLRLARRAVRIVWGEKRLLLLVVLLVSLSLLGRMIQVGIWASKYAHQYQPLPINQQQQSPLRQWRHTLSYEPQFIFHRFHNPDLAFTAAPSAWLNLLLSRFPEFPEIFGLHAEPSKINAVLFTLFQLLWLALLMAAITPFSAVILGWLSALARGAPPLPWLAYIKQYYWRLILFGFLIVFASQVFIFIDIFFPPNISLGPDASIGLLYRYWHIFHFDLYFPVLFPIAYLFLCLTPYIIIARNTAVWPAAKESARTVWRHKWSLLTLLLIFRFTFEAIQLLRYSLPTTFPFSFQIHPGYSYISLLPMLLEALLGLWLATAFMLLVTHNTTPAPTP